MSVTVKYTYQDLLTIPEDRNRYELFDGDLVVTPAPGVEHQLAVGNIYAMLRAHVQTHQLGLLLVAPVDICFAEDVVVQPDVVFVSAGRTSLVGKRRIEGAPDLIVEVLSPSTEERDRGYKFKLYAQQGVREYWLADPEARSLEIHTLTESGYQLVGRFTHDAVLRSKLFPDLTSTITGLWE
jgi:Uma2 family endonuclease